MDATSIETFRLRSAARPYESMGYLIATVVAKSTLSIVLALAFVFFVSGGEASMEKCVAWLGVCILLAIVTVLCERHRSTVKSRVYSEKVSGLLDTWASVMSMLTGRPRADVPFPWTDDDDNSVLQEAVADLQPAAVRPHSPSASTIRLRQTTEAIADGLVHY